MASTAHDAVLHAALDAQLASYGIVAPPGSDTNDKMRLLVDGPPAADRAPSADEEVDVDMDEEEETFKDNLFLSMSREALARDPSAHFTCSYQELDRQWQLHKMLQRDGTSATAPGPSSNKPKLGQKQTSAGKDKKTARAASHQGFVGSSKGASSSGKRRVCEPGEGIKMARPLARSGEAKVTLQSPRSQTEDGKDKTAKKSVVPSQGLAVGPGKITRNLMRSILMHDVDCKVEDVMVRPLPWLFQEWKRKFEELYNANAVEGVITDDEVNGILSVLLPDAEPEVIARMTTKFKIDKINEYV